MDVEIPIEVLEQAFNDIPAANKTEWLYLSAVIRDWNMRFEGVPRSADNLRSAYGSVLFRVLNENEERQYDGT